MADKDSSSAMLANWEEPEELRGMRKLVSIKLYRRGRR
jgi:hypothetical protein